MPNFFSEHPNFSQTEIEPKKDFYEKLNHSTLWTVESLDAAREKNFGADLIERTKYVKEFEEEFGQFSRVVFKKEFLEKVKAAEIVFGGDLHDLEKATDNLIRVLEEFKNPQLVLGVECVEAGKQTIIDDYLADKISEKEFIKNSGLVNFVPAQTKNYLKIFQIAKREGLKILALDSSVPARGFTTEERLKKRDETAAEIIAKEFKQNQKAQMYVIFGQTHLAENHLPGKVKEKLPEASSLIFVQNHESLYCQALKKFGQVPLIAGIAELEKNKYAILDVSPLEIRFERLKQQHLLREGKRDAIDSTGEEYFPFLLDFLSKNFNLDLEKLCFYYEEGRCEKTLKDILSETDIGYDDRELGKTLTKKEKEKFKQNKVLSFIKDETPYLMLKRGSQFKEFAKGTTQLIFAALEKANLAKFAPKDKEAFVYLGAKFAKPDLRPETKEEERGEALWQKLFIGETELKIV